MKKAALIIALSPLLLSTQLSTAAHAQNAVALCNLYQMRGSSPNSVIDIPAPTDAPQLGASGMVEIHKDGKVTSNGQDITAATTTLCASNPKPGAEEAGMHGDTASSDTTPVKHVVHHKHKAVPKTDANADTTTGGTDITAAPVTAPAAPPSTTMTAPATPAAQPGMLAPKTATPSSANSNMGAGAMMAPQTVPTAPPGTPSPSPDQHQEKTTPVAPPAQ